MIEALPRPASPPPALDRPRLGFAGVGWIGRHRLEALVRAEAATVTAVFDPVPEATGALCSMAAGFETPESFEDLLALPLDGVVIATPSALHAPQCIAALEAGKAVFCQKPLARTAAETRAVLSAARKADRLLGVDFSYRAHPGMRRIRELIASGALGHIYAIDAQFHNAYGPDKPWFYHAPLAGGGCLLDLGVHLVDLALWCLDFPAVEDIAARLHRRGIRFQPNGKEVEDHAAALLSLAGGTSMQLSCSWGAPAGCDARIGLTFFGTAGGAAFANVAGSFHDFTAEHLLPDRTRRTLTGPPDEWGGQAAIEWARRLAADAAFDPAAAHFLAVAETLDRIYQCA